MTFSVFISGYYPALHSCCYVVSQVHTTGAAMLHGSDRDYTKGASLPLNLRSAAKGSDFCWPMQHNAITNMMPSDICLLFPCYTLPYLCCNPMPSVTVTSLPQTGLLLP
mgnify:CR=1 FL=1